METRTIIAENEQDLITLSKIIKILKLKVKISIYTENKITAKKRTVKKTENKPNKTTIATLNDVLEGKVIKTKNVDDFLKKINL